MDERVTFRAHFERYPVSMKGAFVLRAADGIPHQVVFERGRCVELASGLGRPLGVEGAVVDVAPNLDLFVPFEFPSTDLASGWYRLECEVLVDGTPSETSAGEPFVVAWPRASVRRGRVEVGRPIDAGSTKAEITAIECGPDTTRVTYEASQPIALRMAADGRDLAIVTQDHDVEAGSGSITAYPALRDEGELVIRPRGSEDELRVPLP